MQDFIESLLDKKFKISHLSQKNIKRYKYICPCSYNNWRKQRFKKHTNECSQFRSTVISIMIDDNKSNLIKQFQKPYNNQMSFSAPILQPPSKKISQLSQRLDKVQTELGIGDKRFQVHNEVQTATKKCLQSLRQPVLNQLSVSIQPLISYAIERKMDLNQVFLDIQQGILKKMTYLKLSECLDEFRKNLNQFHSWLSKQRQNQSVSQRTIKRDRDGFNFWKRFKKVNRMNLIQILQELKSLNSTGVISALIYFRKMCHSGFFLQLPQIPKSFSTRKIMKRQKIKISIESVRSEVMNLISQQKFIYGCDLWYCTCLGLRSSELLDVPIQNSQNDFYDLVRITERKNKHQTFRVIPQSLKQLVMKYNIVYPLTKDRLKGIRQHCITLFGRFYSLRSTCLTMIFRSLFQANQFARFHRNYQTSVRFYVDLQSKEAINKGFQLKGFGQRQFIKDSGLMIFKQDGEWIEKGYQSSKQQFNMQESVFTQQEDKSDLIYLGEEYIDENELSSTQITQIKYQIDLASKGVEINQEVFQNLSDCLKDSVQDKDFQLMLKQYETFLEQTQSQQVGMPIQQMTEDLYDISVNVIHIQENCITNKYASKNNDSQNKIVVLQTKDEEQLKFKSNSLQLQKRIPSPLSIQLRKRVEGKKNNVFVDYFFRRKKINCRICNQEINEKQCSGHYRFQCDNGHVIDHNCSNQHFIEQTPNIFTDSKLEVNPGLKQITYLKKLNNINQYISRTQRVNHYVYHNTVPSSIFTKLNILDEESTKIIKRNIEMQDFLPLKISKSSIEESGNGVFAISKIMVQDLICVYLGEIGTNESCRITQQSLYSIGYLFGNQTFTELLIIPDLFKNIGRFINSSSKQDQNCRPYLGLIKNKQGKNQFIIYIICTKEINPGDELFYFYGTKYWALQQQLNLNNQKQKVKQFFLKQKSQQRNQLIIKKSDKKLSTNQIQKLFQETITKKSVIVGKLRSIKYLIKRYPNKDCTKYFKKIQRSYGFYRPVKGDGNCLYRTLILHYLRLKKFQKKQQVFKPINILITNQFGKSVNFEQLLDYCYIKFIDPLQFLLSEQERQQHLVKSINSSEILDVVLISYTRSICYQQLVQNKSKYQLFDSSEIETRVFNFVCEAQQPEIVIISTIFQLSTTIIYFSNISSQQIRIWNITDFSQQNQVHLFFRPGHYQFIYPTFIISQKAKKKAFQFTNILLQSQEYIQLEDITLLQEEISNSSKEIVSKASCLNQEQSQNRSKGQLISQMVEQNQESNENIVTTSGVSKVKRGKKKQQFQNNQIKKSKPIRKNIAKKYKKKVQKK